MVVFSAAVPIVAHDKFGIDRATTVKVALPQHSALRTAYRLMCTYLCIYVYVYIYSFIALRRS